MDITLDELHASSIETPVEEPIVDEGDKGTSDKPIEKPTDEPTDGTDPSDQNTPPDGTEEPEGDEGSKGSDDDGKEGKGKDDDEGNSDNLSGIEKYLSAFNIEGGMLDFEDGSKKHFDELEPDKQAEILNKLHESAAQSVEEKYGLDENEITLINYLREQGKDFNEVIGDLATQRAEAYIASQNAQNLDIEKMSNDDVYAAFLRNSNPEATVEQIEEDLKKAKEMSNYENITKSIKDRMLKEHESTLTAQKEESKNKLFTEIEDQRKEVVAVVSKLETVDGLTINDGIKNDVLDSILNVDEDGDSVFMTEVFGDPEKLFTAAFWYRNGKDILATREEYWKKEKSAAYKRGLQEAGDGKKTFTSKDVKDKKSKETTPHYDRSDDIISFDQLHNINS